MINSAQKIQLLQTITGLNQQKLAEKLHVTVTTLNRWYNHKATPHPTTLRRIDTLLEELGIQSNQTDPLSTKKIFLAGHRQPHLLINILKQPDIYDSLLLALTYNSNSIEGSTLTEADTAAVLFDDVTLSNKTLVEHLEAKNHATAMQFLFTWLAQGKPIDESLILKLHSILMNAIYPDAGLYRRHAVRIVGSRTVTANYLKIPDRMQELCTELQKRPTDIIRQVSVAHAHFEQIHPFSDGNGRIGRLIIAGMLLRAGLPPAIIAQKKRQRYYTVLERAQTIENYQPLEEFICDAVLVGLRIVGRK